MANLVAGLAAFGLEGRPMLSTRGELPTGLSILHVKSSLDRPKADHFIVSEGKAAGDSIFAIPGSAEVEMDTQRVLEVWEGAFIQVHPWEPEGEAPTFPLLFAGILFGLLLSYRRPRRREAYKC